MVPLLLLSDPIEVSSENDEWGFDLGRRSRGPLVKARWRWMVPDGVGMPKKMRTAKTEVPKI